MIFPSIDRVLLTQELRTYGITYADSLDCLFIAPELKRHPERIRTTIVYGSPLDIVALLLYGDDFVGVLFPSVSDLIHYFWNGRLPEEVPSEYLADMMDLCLADLRFQNVIQSEEALRVRVMHICAREILKSSGILPNAIVERMRDTLGTLSATVH